jgi:hypothetical protein
MRLTRTTPTGPSITQRPGDPSFQSQEGKIRAGIFYLVKLFSSAKDTISTNFSS